MLYAQSRVLQMILRRQTDLRETNAGLARHLLERFTGDDQLFEALQRIHTVTPAMASANRRKHRITALLLL
jgi:hypothetical protein